VWHVLLDHVDSVRRRAGRLLDAVGAAPQVSPSTTVTERPGVRLRHFPGAPPGAPAVLLVPAPIKRWYIWDLEPQVSVVARTLAHGLDVYMVEWTDPGPAEQDFGLEEYAGRMLYACVEAVTRLTAQSRVVLFGHSLGGTLAAVFAARHPEMVRGLAVLEAPLHFGRDAGAFAPLVALLPRSDRTPAANGTVPGSLLNIVTAVADPVSIQAARYADLLLSLGDRDLFRTHMRVERWTLDEFALPGRLFHDVLERLYRRDEFASGELTVTGRQVGPATLTVPMCTVVDPYSRLIPPESILPVHRAAAATPKRLLRYRGDVGVALQHVGVLVGRNAHRHLWPLLLQWADDLPHLAPSNR
jgi:polyhydroxyalkanoate synthase